MNRLQALLLAALIAVASFAAGFYFDRSLHRPIEIHFTTVRTTDRSGVWPAHRSVCDSFGNICWKTT